MKHLLERWAALEPHLCKRETRPNKDWHEEFESYYIILPLSDGSARWNLVATDTEPSFYLPECMMKIQRAVQQAIIEKGWYFQITYNREYYSVEMGLRHPSPRFTRNYESLVEALLTSYLAELEASANP